MKKIEIKSPHVNFIGAWNIENNNLCDEIIKIFEENKNLHKKGKTLSGLNPTFKKNQTKRVRAIYKIFQGNMKPGYKKSHLRKRFLKKNFLRNRLLFK